MITHLIDQLGISIHAAQEGCDVEYLLGEDENDYFNPRSPRGLRLTASTKDRLVELISIHAAQEGCDNNRQRLPFHRCHFNPRSPRGLRQRNFFVIKRKKRFKSTQPEWAATMRFTALAPTGSRFQSTQPKRAATNPSSDTAKSQAISIHAAQEGCDSHFSFIFYCW